MDHDTIADRVFAVRNAAKALRNLLDYVDDPDWGDEITDTVAQCATDLPRTAHDRALRLVEDMSEEGAYIDIDSVLGLIEASKTRIDRLR